MGANESMPLLKAQGNPALRYRDCTSLAVTSLKTATDIT